MNLYYYSSFVINLTYQFLQDMEDELDPERYRLDECYYDDPMFRDFEEEMEYQEDPEFYELLSRLELLKDPIKSIHCIVCFFLIAQDSSLHPHFLDRFLIPIKGFF